MTAGATMQDRSRPARLGQSTRVPDGCPLSDCEYEVLALVAEGVSTTQIAADTGRARSTVSHQVHTGCKRLGVNSRVEAVIVMKDSGWLGAKPRRPNEQDPPLTPGQTLYLRAFDGLLAKRDREAEAGVTVCFAAMCWESGARPQRRTSDIDGWLLSMAQRLARPIADEVPNVLVAA